MECKTLFQFAGCSKMKNVFLKLSRSEAMLFFLAFAKCFYEIEN